MNTDNTSKKQEPQSQPAAARAHDGDTPSEGEGGHGHHVKHTPEEWAKRLDAPDRVNRQKPAALVAMLGLSPGETVAEVGAGTGYFLKYLSRAVGEDGRVLALDVESDLVDHMTRRARAEGLENVTAKQCPFDDPALPAAEVDRILIVNTWHHISKRVDYGKKLLDGLKPGGALYVVDFDKDASVGPPPKAKLTSEQVISELERAGFMVALLEENLPEQYVIRALGR